MPDVDRGGELEPDCSDSESSLLMPPARLSSIETFLRDSKNAENVLSYENRNVSAGMFREGSLIIDHSSGLACFSLVMQGNNLPYSSVSEAKLVLGLDMAALNVDKMRRVVRKAEGILRAQTEGGRDDPVAINGIFELGVLKIVREFIKELRLENVHVQGTTPGADFSGLRWIDLVNVNLSALNLNRSVFNGTMRGLTIEDSFLLRAAVKVDSLGDGMKIRSSDLSHSHIEGNLAEVSFIQCILEDTDFSGASARFLDLLSTRDYNDNAEGAGVYLEGSVFNRSTTLFSGDERTDALIVGNLIRFSREMDSGGAHPEIYQVWRNLCFCELDKACQITGAEPNVIKRMAINDGDIESRRSDRRRSMEFSIHDLLHYLGRASG